MLKISHFKKNLKCGIKVKVAQDYTKGNPELGVFFCLVVNVPCMPPINIVKLSVKENKSPADNYEVVSLDTFYPHCVEKSWIVRLLTLC